MKKGYYYFLRRIGFFILSFSAIITLTFLLMKSIPGNPFQEEQFLPKEMEESIKKNYGLDRSLSSQFLTYLKAIAKGDFGYSYKYPHRKVREIILEGFVVSGLLGLQALCLAIFLGIFLGCIAARYHQQWQDTLILFLTTAGVSMPSFILATFLQYFFAIHYDILPIGRWEDFSHTILPTVALATLPIAFISRLIRSNLIEVFQADYIKTARAKGLGDWQILYRHGLRNSIIPVLSYLGPLLANMLFGSFIIEKVFNIPGLGFWLITSVSYRDYPLIMGLTIFYSLILLLAILLIDCLYGLIDPRIRRTQQEVL